MVEGGSGVSTGFRTTLSERLSRTDTNLEDILAPGITTEPGPFVDHESTRFASETFPNHPFQLTVSCHVVLTCIYKGTTDEDFLTVNPRDTILDPSYSLPRAYTAHTTGDRETSGVVGDSAWEYLSYNPTRPSTISAPIDQTYAQAQPGNSYRVSSGPQWWDSQSLSGSYGPTPAHSSSRAASAHIENQVTPL